MSAPLAIRSAVLDDAPAMLSLLEPIVTAANLTAMTGPLELAGQRRFIGRFPRDGVFLVALAQERLVGMQDVLLVPEEPGVGEISTFVALDRARCGIGRALFERSLLASRERRIDRLRAVVLAANPVARAFYASLQFRSDSDALAPRGGCADVTVVLERPTGR